MYGKRAGEGYMVALGLAASGQLTLLPRGLYITRGSIPRGIIGFSIRSSDTQLSSRR